MLSFARTSRSISRWTAGNRVVIDLAFDRRECDGARHGDYLQSRSPGTDDPSRSQTLIDSQTIASSLRVSGVSAQGVFPPNGG